jgi:hypothetical protein
VLVKDFETDLKYEIKRISDDIGIKVKLTDGLDKVLRDYLTVRLKLIDLKKRKVRFCPDFYKELGKHPQKKEVEHIAKLAESGGNLNVFQSRRLLQTGFHDHLMSEWNIYHFHLSLKPDKKSKFVKQVDQLLFAFIDGETIVFLGTDTHREGIFADVKWIEVLHDHFPELIEKYRDYSKDEVSPIVNASERQTLWNKGYTLGMTKVRDAVYLNPGIGRSASGHSSDVITTEISILRWIYKINEQIDECSFEICQYLDIDMDKARFKVKFDDTLALYEITTGIKLFDFPQVLIEKEELKNRLSTGYNNI